MANYDEQEPKNQTNLNEGQEEHQQKHQQQHQHQHQQQYYHDIVKSESTIINIPIEDSSEVSTAASTATAAATIPKIITLRTSLEATNELSSSSYDTDCSVASSTCCTSYGEHIYMQRCSIDMLEQHQQHEQHHQHHNHHNHHDHHFQDQKHFQQQHQPQHYDDLNDEEYYKADHHKKSWPFFIVLISLLEIAIFVYDYMTVPKSLQQQQNPEMLPVPIPTDSVFIYRPDRRLEVWRFVSYMFLHANSFHLGFNVVVQLFYGIPLEVMHGSTRVAIIYFAGVFAGSLGTSVVDSEVYLVGASGGVYALLAAHLANITLNYGQMRYAVAQLLSVVIFVSCDLAYAFYTQYLAVDVLSKAPPVSYIAHLTGALAGLTIGLLVLKNFERRAYENVIWWLALGVYSAFTVFAIVFNLINTVTAQLIEEQGEVITQHLLHDLGVS